MSPPTADLADACASGSSRTTDRHLLDRFVTHQDQAAFAELVARHGPCVWNVCRRVAGQEQDAEDAFQAVFLILGRKAGAIRKRESVASWLYGVAFRTASKLRRAASRRQKREEHAGSAAPPAPPPELAAARELERALDEEVARLAEKFRAPFVLCCLQGQTRGEAAQQLGWSEGTVSSRLAQARELLQHRLVRRGFAVSAVVLAAAMSNAIAAAAAPASLVACAVQAGVAGNAAAGFSPAALALADHIAHALLVLKLKTIVAASLSFALLLSAASFAALRLSEAPEQDAPAAAPLIAAPPAVAVRTGKPNDVWSAAISPDGKLAAAGTGWWTEPGEVGLWDLGSRKLLFQAFEKKGIASVAFSPDGTLLASAGWTGAVRLREVPSGKEVADFTMPGVTRLAFSPDGKLLAASAEARIIRLFDVAKREPIATLQDALLRFHQVTFSPDGKWLLATAGEWKTGGACEVTIWDVDTRMQIGKLAGHQLAVICITFSPDGKTIATGGLDHMIRLWDAETWTEIKTLQGHEGWVETLAFTKDGKTLVSGALDGTMRFWDLALGRETAKLGGAPAPLAIPPPGNDADSLKEVAAAPWPFTGSVRAIRFTPDGKTLLVGGGPRMLRLFDAATHQETGVLWEAPPQPMIARPARVVTPERAPAALQPIGEPAAPPRDLPERLDIRLDKDVSGYPDVYWFGPQAAQRARTEPKGLRLTLPAERPELQDVGIDSHKVLRGDFEITLPYELLAVPVPGPAGGAGVVLEAFFDGPDAPKARLARTQKVNGPYFGSTFYLLGEDGRQKGHGLVYPRAREKVTAGKLRLVRTGGQLAFQADEGDGFRTIATKESGGTDVVSVRAFATAFSKPVLVDVRLGQLDLRWAPATRLASAAAAETPRSRGRLVAALLFTLTALVVGGVLIVFRRRGRESTEIRPPALRGK